MIVLCPRQALRSLLLYLCLSTNAWNLSLLEKRLEKRRKIINNTAVCCPCPTVLQFDTLMDNGNVDVVEL